MCKKATCDSCQKTTWWGCGKHITSVMESVPLEQWCTCVPRVEQQGQQYPPKGTLSSA
ncbi:cytochrome P450 [Pyrenophora seminiperda CCB06]|uniref:Cytochrome P450 n=1 Tax=Pyrenophora seminiperda CCB06 TaxID=1302712 RepID=A0A3M7MET7_9PLEO|nr:cytochrome P450 [Pyrenophora seminiperda CCB06]